jgi:16S rRNA (uracil1498-N3)-methyltransferase
MAGYGWSFPAADRQRDNRSMHRLYVPPEQLAGAARIKLTAEQSRRLLTVLRLAPGAQIEVFDGEGGRFLAVLTDQELQIGNRVHADRRKTDVVLVQALAKGEKMDLVVQKATELGVTRIVPLSADRAVVRLDSDRGRSRAARWRRIAQEASRQCGRADVPRIDEPMGWEGIFSLARDDDRRALLLDPVEQELRLGAAARGVSRLLLAVGPEGGFSPDEKARAAEATFVPAGLGPLVLRTETAGLAALAVVLHVNGELG